MKISKRLSLVVVALMLLASIQVNSQQEDKKDKEVVVVNTPLNGMVSDMTNLVVSNTVSEPAPVVSMNNGKQPFQNTQVIIIAAGDTGKNVNFRVPDGKLLIIEHAAIEARIPSGQKVKAVLGAKLRVGVQLQVSGTRFPFTVVTDFRETKDLWIADVKTLVFVNDPYSNPDWWWSIGRNSDSGMARIEASVSGYLVDK